MEACSHPLRPMPKGILFGHRPRGNRHLLALKPEPSIRPLQLPCGRILGGIGVVGAVLFRKTD